MTGHDWATNTDYPYYERRNDGVLVRIARDHCLACGTLADSVAAPDAEATHPGIPSECPGRITGPAHCFAINTHDRV